ncbi:MAG: hypothetical protein KA802_12475 [Saprospiraceae bacterium]|nr:hypothetical protein [Saprospiraceae bacterium]
MPPKKKKQVKYLPKEQPLKIDMSFEQAIKATMIAADKKIKNRNEKSH